MRRGGIGGSAATASTDSVQYRGTRQGSDNAAQYAVRQDASFYSNRALSDAVSLPSSGSEENTTARHTNRPMPMVR